ncbi:MAG: cysteine hydrolase family protein [Anaerovibrio sp.]
MKKLYVVVDMQKDFIDGSLGTKEAQEMLPRMAERLAELQASEETDIVFTMDTHGSDYLETQEGKNLSVQHCVKGTDGWQIAEVLQEFAEKAVAIVEKPSFGYTGWQEIAAGYDEITLGGLCTDICVISNAMLLKAFFPEIKIRIDSTCCAGVTAESHINALNAMKMCQMEII